MKKPIFWALALHFGLAMLLIFRIPIGASPDEGAHFDFIRFVATNWQIPVFRSQAPPAYGYEFHQPPLYYALCAPLWAILPETVAPYTARFTSLLCGLGTIFLLYRAAQTVFTSRQIPILTAFFAALSPLQLGLSAGANNDGLAGLICAGLFLLMARAWQNGPEKKLVWGVGILVALGLWTKNTTLTVSVIAVLSLFFAAKKHDFARPFVPFGNAFLIALIVALPLLARNQTLYGDPLGLSVFSAAAKKVAPGFFAFEAALGLSFFEYARAMAWQIFLTTWGFFGGPSSAQAATKPLLPGGPRLNDMYLAPLLLLALLFPLASALGWRRLGEIGEKWHGVWPFWLAAMMLVFLAWCNFAFNFFAGGQARYLHPAFVPFCLLFCAGFAAIFHARLWLFATIFALFLLSLTLLNLFVWRTLV